MKSDPALVEAVAARTTDPNADQPPRYTTLDLAGLPARLQPTIPELEATILEALRPDAKLTENAA